MIIENIRQLINRIDQEGIIINSTREITGVIYEKIDVTNIDLLAEENEIRNYYQSLGINTQVIRSLEHNLYEFIYRGLKQSIEQLFYFDHSQDYTSRRFVFSTTDCISHVQIIYRNGEATLYMHIRSTDVKKLFPWDFLFAAGLIGRILTECRFPPVFKKYLTITIGSAHYYLQPKSMY